MKIILEIDVDSPPSQTQLQKAYSWLGWMIDNHPGGTETIVDQDLPVASMTGAAVAQAFAPPVPPVANHTPATPSDALATPPAEAAGRAAAAPAPSAPAGLELDSTGAPWSDRVCASTKKQNADGTWTKRKGVDVALYNQVMAEGRALAGSAPVAAAGTVPPAPPAANVPPPPPPPAGTVPPPPLAGNVPPPPPASAPAAPSDGVLAAVQAITASIVEGKITMPELSAQCILHGHANLSDLQSDARALGTVCAHFKQAGKL